MVYKIKLLPSAFHDLREARKWYREINVELAEDFKIAINKEIDSIGNYPEHHQIKYKELRQAVVTRFTYSVFYLIEEAQKSVIIFGVLHTSQNPEVVQQRISK